MTEEEKAKMAKLEADLAEANKAKEALERSVAEKDAIIEQKNQDIIGARKETQKIKKLSEEDKQSMSEKEIEHHEALLAQQEEAEQLRKDIAERDKRDFEARRDNAVKRLAGDNKELADKVRANFDRIKDSDKAVTEDEIGLIANDAYNMLGEARPDPVSSALNGAGQGGNPAGGGEQRFSDTEKGKQAAKELGIPLEKEAEAK